jgi:hypothetical protein
VGRRGVGELSPCRPSPPAERAGSELVAEGKIDDVWRWLVSLHGRATSLNADQLIEEVENAKRRGLPENSRLWLRLLSSAGPRWGETPPCGVEAASSVEFRTSACMQPLDTPSHWKTITVKRAR